MSALRAKDNPAPCSTSPGGARPYYRAPAFHDFRRKSALTRLRAFLLFAALAGMATVFGACGGGGGGSDENPQTVLEDATFEGIENADLDLSIGVDVSGDEGGSIDIGLFGPFQSRGEDLPELDMTVEASGSVKGEDIDFDAGLVLLPNRAYVDYEGTDYEVDPTTFSFVQSAIEQAQKESGAQGGTAGATACQEAVAGRFKVGDYVDNLTNEGSADVGGADTTKVSGDLDVAGALDAVSEILEIPACKSQAEAAGTQSLPELESATGEIEKALKSAHAEIYVGDDDIIRRLTAQFTIEPEGEESVTVDLDLTLSGVNEGQQIEIPSGAKPLNELFLKLGINPIELLEGAQSGKGLGPLLEQLGGGAGSLGGSLPGAQ
jgi:hypothetical protein